MNSAKPVTTRLKSADVFVKLALRYSTQVFIRIDSIRRPLEAAYEGPFKVLQLEPRYYIIDKNGTNDCFGIDGLEAVYLVGNPVYVYFPSVQ